MDVVDILAIVVLVAAASTAYLFYASKRRRDPQRFASVSPPGLKVRPLAEVPTAIRPTSPPPRPGSPRPAPPRPAAARATTPEPPVAASAPAPVGASPPPLFDLNLDIEPPVLAAVPAEIRWSKQFDPRSGTLDETARLRLIGDLGVIAKEWCVPLLAQAYEEESKPAHRQAALIGLAACRSRAAATTFRAALAAGDAAERAIAADGLADLEPAPQTKLRRTVERH